MGSADLQVAITDLRNALGDELGGNDQVRDCAFEVVAAYDREIAARATHCARCNTTGSRAGQRLALRADVPDLRRGRA